MAPLRLPGFRQLAGAYTFNELGNWVGEIALAVLVFDETNSPLATAALFIGMHFLPAFLSQFVVARTEPIGTKRVLPALYLRFGGRGLAPADELLLRWAEAEAEPERTPEPEKEEEKAS